MMPSRSAAILVRCSSRTGPFFAGANLHVVDLKLYMIERWLGSGTLETPVTIHGPTDLAGGLAVLLVASAERRPGDA